MIRQYSEQQQMPNSMRDKSYGFAFRAFAPALNGKLYRADEQVSLVAKLSVDLVVKLPGCGELGKIGKPAIQHALYIVGCIT